MEIPSTDPGSDKHAEALLPQVYEELRKLAYHHMAMQSATHTLQPTALVHEAWIKLTNGQRENVEDKSAFLSIASTAMRHVLIDHARSKVSQKRGGQRQRVDLETIGNNPNQSNETILQINDALQQLERTRPDWAHIVEMKFFGGMTNKEVATALNKSESTIERYWSAAKAWLHKQLLLEK